MIGLKYSLKSSVAAVAVFLLCISANAMSSPVVMLESITTQMIHSLEQNKSRIKQNPRAVDTYVQQILLPHVDVGNMSRSVLGRKAWSDANAAQQQQFSQEFQKLVVRTYSAALAEYDKQKVDYAPLRGGYTGKKFIQVNSVINQASGSNIRVNYRLFLQGSQWKVYDFSVDGISMVQSYRSQFAPIVNSKGIDGLLAKLKSRNQS